MSVGVDLERCLQKKGTRQLGSLAFSLAPPQIMGQASKHPALAIKHPAIPDLE